MNHQPEIGAPGPADRRDVVGRGRHAPHPDRLEALASYLASTVRPRNVICRGREAEALASTLQERGVTLGSADAACDLLVRLDLPSGSRATPLEPVAGAGMASAARMLIACAPEADAVDRHLAGFAAAGFVPTMRHDPTCVWPGAVLLEQTDQPPSARELAAFEEVVRSRLTIQRQNQALAQLNQRVAALDGSFAAEPRSSMQQASAQVEFKLMALHADLAQARYERDIVLASTLWRVMQPIRRLVTALPSRMRRLARTASRQALGGNQHAIAAATLAYDTWVKECDTLSDDDRTQVCAHVDALRERPLISIVLRGCGAAAQDLRAAIASVRAQLYPDWELCVVHDAASGTPSDEVLIDAASESRVRLVRALDAGDPALVANTGIGIATGAFVAVMEADDRLTEQALYEMAVELVAHPKADIVYGDEDRIDDAGHRHTPHFKSGWNIDLMLGTDMVGRMAVFRRTLLERIGGARQGFAGSDMYDMALRCAAETTPARIRHIPAMLCHRHDGATAALRPDGGAARRAVRDFLDATGIGENARLADVPALPHATRVQWALPDPPPRASLIVPTRDHADLLRCCTRGLLERTDYPDFELIIVDNDSADPDALELLERLKADPRVRVIPFPGAFNYSAINNAAAALATGDVLVLINNDIDVIDPGWLREMVSQAVRPGVGAVGARLLFGDGSVQHAGVALGIGTFDGGPGIAGHLGIHDAGGYAGYFGQSKLTREVSAVTAACLAIRKSVFESVGGLDADNLAVAFNDVDLCLRLREAGWRNIWTPFAELYHLESASRGLDLAGEKKERFRRECRFMRRRWEPTLDNDPFHNINFTRFNVDFRPSIPSRRIKPWERWA